MTCRKANLSNEIALQFVGVCWISNVIRYTWFQSLFDMNAHYDI
jgi:hypothetical protein